MLKRPVRILAVDDESEVLEYYRTLFQGDGLSPEDLLREYGAVDTTTDTGFSETPFQVEIDLFSSGEEAIHQIGEQTHAVAILDVIMPAAMGGLELAQALLEKSPSTRIIFVSAHMGRSLDTIKNALKSNFTFLKKPFDSSELLQLTTFSIHDWMREWELVEARHRALQAKREEEEFLATISHELRTPLTAIIGNSEMLLQELGAETELAEMGHTILTSGHSLLALVNDILDVSKIESGKFSIHEAPYDRTFLLQQMRTMFAERAANHGIELTIEERSVETSLLIGDGQRISQILINLLGNAIKFTAAGGRVALLSWSEFDKLYYRVEDSGKGMAPEQVDKLFQRYEQTDTTISSRFGGTGLGLYISENLATMMDGTIEVESEEGVGSTFTLILPRHSSQQAVKQEGLDTSVGDGEPGSLQGRVLLAEDTLVIQLLARRMLEKMGVTVESVDNGKDAVEQALQGQFDLILMDMQMPLMNGLEATREILAQGGTTPIIALTANAMEQHQQQFAEAGCCNFIAKPFDYETLYRSVAPWLGTQKSAADGTGTDPLKGEAGGESTTAGRKESMLHWSEELSVHDPLLDQHHRQLFEYANQLTALTRENKKLVRGQVMRLLPKIIELSEVHFIKEEEHMRSIGYPQTAEHTESHQVFLKVLADLYSLYGVIQDSRYVQAFSENLSDLLMDHFLTEDMDFKHYIEQQQPGKQ